jgi:hypothetical protein
MDLTQTLANRNTVCGILYAIEAQSPDMGRCDRSNPPEKK